MATSNCKWCGRWQTQHSINTCSYFQASLLRGDMRAIKLKAKIDSGGKRVCGYCAGLDHTSITCEKKFNDKKQVIVKSRAVMDPVFAWLHEIGFGTGAMISGMASDRFYRAGDKGEKIVVIEDFRQQTLINFINELAHGKNKNWFMVNAVDTTNEKIRRIYLPYHELYSPKPTSKNVSIVHRANEEDIEKMKMMLETYTSPVIHYNTAKEFFAAGHKFKAGSNEVV